MSSIPPAPSPQPFYTSKTFWTLVIAFAINMANTVVPGTVSTAVQTYGTEALAILAIIFRWTADQPLALTSGTKLP